MKTPTLHPAIFALNKPKPRALGWLLSTNSDLFGLKPPETQGALDWSSELRGCDAWFSSKGRGEGYGTAGQNHMFFCLFSVF